MEINFEIFAQTDNFSALAKSPEEKLSKCRNPSPGEGTILIKFFVLGEGMTHLGYKPISHTCHAVNEGVFFVNVTLRTYMR